MNGAGCDVAILAGGQGTRLRERAGPLPKPMVPLLGRPILDHQLDLCRLHGFRRILLLVHYNHEAIRAHVGDGSRYGLSVEYAVESTPRGTAGALGDVLPRLVRLRARRLSRGSPTRSWSSTATPTWTSTCAASGRHTKSATPTRRCSSIQTTTRRIPTWSM
jgi:hypothetical protein